VAKQLDGSSCRLKSIKLEKPFDLNWSKMMPPPGLKIYLRPRETLIFDLLTP